MNECCKRWSTLRYVIISHGDDSCPTYSEYNIQDIIYCPSCGTQLIELCTCRGEVTMEPACGLPHICDTCGKQVKKGGSK